MGINEQKLSDEQTFRRLTDGPVLRTWHGCIERVKYLSIGERWLLCWFLRCDMDGLDRALYWYARQKRRQEATEESACE